MKILSNEIQKYDLKCIDIVLENCEVFRIDAKYINILSIENIMKSIHFSNGSIRNSFRAEAFLIKISPTFNIDSSYATSWKEGRNSSLPFDRLTACNDITAISLYYNDSRNTEEYIYMNWPGDDEYNNLCQTSMISEFDNSLVISISPTSTAEEYIKRNG